MLRLKSVITWRVLQRGLRPLDTFDTMAANDADAQLFPEWDRQLDLDDPPLSDLLAQMLARSQEPDGDNVNLWWRVGKATYLQAMDMPREGHLAKETKFDKAIAYLRRALRLEPNNFEAHLWSAVAKSWQALLLIMYVVKRKL